MPTLADAIALAAEAHRTQLDKAGEPYVLHPLRVMLRLQTEEERIVGVLHDVVEDTPVGLDELRRRGYSERVIAAVDALTRRKGLETYEAFVERLSEDPLATRVKISDLEDNMDLRRLPVVGPEEAERLARYRAAWGKLKRLVA